MSNLKEVMDASFLISKKLAMGLSKELLELYNSDTMKKTDESIYTFVPLNTIAYFLASNCIALSKSYQEAGNIQSTPEHVYLAIMELTQRYMADATKERAGDKLQ